MSQQNPYWQPPPVPPQSVIGYHTPMYAPRPQAASVIGIIGIVWASLGILLSLWMLVGALFFRAFGRFARQVAGTAMPNFDAYMIWQAITSAAWIIISAFLLTAAIGLLRNAGWSRKLMIVAAIAAIAWVVVGIVGSTMAQQAMMRQFAAATGTPTTGVAVSGMVQLVWGIVLAAFPVVALVFMMRPNIRQWYDQPQLGYAM